MTLGTFLSQLDAEPTPGADQIEAFAMLGAGESRWAAHVCERAVTAIVALSAGERAMWLAPRVRPAVERTVADLLITLRGDDDEATPAGPGPPAAILNPPEQELITALAREDVPFHRIVSGHRVLQNTCIAELLEQAEHYRPARDRIRLLLRLTETVTSFFDATVDGVVAEYQEAREQLITRRLTARRTLVDALLAGSPVGEDDARRSLGLDLAAHHLAAVAFTVASSAKQPGPNDSSDLESVARRAAEAVRSQSDLSVPDESGLWIWLSRSDPFTAVDLQALRSMRITVGNVRLAVGEPGQGAAGFRRSHIAAQDTARLVRTSRAVDPATSVLVHRDVGLIALLLADSERARWFVAEELGRLASDDAATRDLRLTVLSYLDGGSSLVSASEALHVHRNTVVYRLRRAEEQLGRPITQRTLALHAALRLADALQ